MKKKNKFQNEEELINYLNNSKKLYNIGFSATLADTFNLIFYGDDSKILSEKMKFENKDKFKNYLDNIKKELEKDKKMKEFLDDIINCLNSNLNDIYYCFSNIFTTLEENKEYYNVKNILQIFNLKNPINPNLVLNSSLSNRFPEKKFILNNICSFLILDKSKNKIINILNKIQSLNLEKIDKEIKLKIKIIDFFKNEIETPVKENFLEDIWKTLKNKKSFFNENDENDEQIINLNNIIQDYIKKKNEKEFINDFLKVFKSKINNLDFSKNDPQAIDIPPFMKQNNFIVDTSSLD